MVHLMMRPWPWDDDGEGTRYVADCGIDDPGAADPTPGRRAVPRPLSADGGNVQSAGAVWDHPLIGTEG